MHGLLDSPTVFDRLRRELGERRADVLAPALSLRLGRTPIAQAAAELSRQIAAAYPGDTPIDVLGFSIGGVIGRTWIQRLGAPAHAALHQRRQPQQGTLTARPWPRRLFKGLADLRQGSALLHALNNNLDTLAGIDCHSFYSALDLAVLPGWRAVLPIGPRTLLPVATHPQLLRDAAAVVPLARELLRP